MPSIFAACFGRADNEAGAQTALDDSLPGQPPAGCVWKFGYGSNMGLEFLRIKKGLAPLDARRSILKGYALSFPEGRGLDLVEPTFATLKEKEGEEVHGVSVLFNADDAAKLDAQEGPYSCVRKPVLLYDGKSELEVEVYLSRQPAAADHPEGCCSHRYRDILVTGAQEAQLKSTWIEKLSRLPVYSPTPETLAQRASVPDPSALPAWTIDKLRQYNGEHADLEAFPVHTSTCGFIFKYKEVFSAFHGRDGDKLTIPFLDLRSLFLCPMEINSSYADVLRQWTQLLFGTCYTPEAFTSTQTTMVESARFHDCRR
eukprot:SAG31_NODE_234_length_19701_cov_16.835068_5_plen_314_part_00